MQAKKTVSMSEKAARIPERREVTVYFQENSRESLASCWIYFLFFFETSQHLYLWLMNFKLSKEKKKIINTNKYTED